jgi:HEAT repeat protein
VRDAVLAGHRGDLDTARRLAHDGDPAVRAAALGALGRLGELGPAELGPAFEDPEPGVRRRACALTGRMLGLARSPTPAPTADGTAPALPGLAHQRNLVAGLVALLTDTDPSVVEVAAWAVGEGGTADRRAVDALVAVASHHADALCREAAVAALGAVAAPGGPVDTAALGAVLRALDEKPAIRRRAVIALAAFDDPRADEGVRRCLTDRDWQVRQAAEELTDES